MVGREDSGRHFPCSKKMAKIGARVAPADVARTIRIDGPLVFGVTRVLDEHAAFAGVEASMAGGARGQDAIHHVYAERYIVGDLLWTADPHEISRAVFGQKRSNFRCHFA